MRARRVFYVHWNEREGRERVAATKLRGFALEHTSLATGTSSAAFHSLRERPPDVVLIDLGRLPSHGKAVAIVLRESRATRFLPIVFAAGDPKKLPKIREQIPDAIYCNWDGIQAALERAITAPPAPLPRKAERSMHSPLPKKLGFRDDVRALVLNAPPDFEATLGALPPGAAIVRKPGAEHAVIIYFAKAQREIVPAIEKLLPRLAQGGGLWFAWPKKASGVATDLSEDLIRNAALARGLVDNKVCAIDATWSGLRLARRRLR